MQVGYGCTWLRLNAASFAHAWPGASVLLLFNLPADASGIYARSMVSNAALQPAVWHWLHLHCVPRLLHCAFDLLVAYVSMALFSANEGLFQYCSIATCCMAVMQLRFFVLEACACQGLAWYCPCLEAW
jgi:hypothetical protein